MWGRQRYWLTGLTVLVGYTVMRMIIDPAVSAIEAIDPARAGFLGGAGTSS